jgi:hypothetical protein
MRSTTRRPGRVPTGAPPSCSRASSWPPASTRRASAISLPTRTHRPSYLSGPPCAPRPGSILHCRCKGDAAQSRGAGDARRFDVSPAWHAWVAAAPAVQLPAQVGTQSLHRHALGLANRFRAGIGLEPGDSAIVSLATDGTAADAMAAARITGSARAGRLRLSFHVSTSDQDADLAADVLRRHVTSRHPATL